MSVTVIHTETQLRDLSRRFYSEVVQELFLDIESTGLDPYTTRLLLVSMRFNGETFVLDFTRMSTGLLHEYLGFVLNGSAVRKVLHNAVFDTKYLMYYGVELQNVFCTMIAEQVVKAGLIYNAFGLDDVALRRLRRPMNKALRNGFIDRDPAVPITYEEYRYSANDVEVLEGIYHQQLEEIEQKDLHKIIFEIEMPLIPITASMEYTGVLIDTQKMREAIPVIEKIQEKADDALQELALNSGFADQVVFTKDGYTVINPGSQKQMLAFLQHMGIDVPSLGRKELTEWDAAWQRANPEDIVALEAAAADDDLDLGYSHPTLKLLAVAKATDKLKGTYYVGLLHKVNTVTGRIHPGFKQCGAASTGRYSSNAPKLNWAFSW